MQVRPSERSRSHRYWMLCALSTSLLCAQAQTTLPIEVMGAEGTVAGVTLELPKNTSEITSLWLQVHGLEYPGLASVRCNNGPWIRLNNETASVAEPGRSFGGIGGAFATLKMTVPIAAGSLVAGANTIEFRFNRTNGIVSGFRVLALNFLTQAGDPLLPASTFRQDDPEHWAPPLPAQRETAEGERLWRTAPLLASSLPGAPSIRAHCGDCHTQDGRDLKYFNYSNLSIVARSQFHGLSHQQGEQIASYIRSLDSPHPGRPWNPPYQPGPGMQARTAADLAAGAGLEWVLDEDSKTLRSLFPGGKATAATFAPDADLQLRQIPIALQMPDWNHWLPQVHPLDAWGDKFTRSEFNRMYAEPPADRASFFTRWLKARSRFLPRWSPGLTQPLYATLLWQLVKTWEISHQYALESATGVVWSSLIPAATAPATINIPSNPNGMAGSGLINEYFNNAWYELQILLNDGGHRHHGRGPVDWVYVAGHERALERWSATPEPGRVLVTVIAAMQSTDPAIGPKNVAQGWRPDQTIDPRMMVAPEWVETFAGIAADKRREITQAWLEAWLRKSASYPLTAYFQLSQLPGSYDPPQELRAISGGKVWEAAPGFRAMGIDSGLVGSLESWGDQYMAMSSLFQY